MYDDDDHFHDLIMVLLGNFCPICRLCYSDDDWECKMIGCSMCDSWTHSKCENLPGKLFVHFKFILRYIDISSKIDIVCLMKWIDKKKHTETFPIGVEFLAYKA